MKILEVLSTVLITFGLTIGACGQPVQDRSSMNRIQNTATGIGTPVRTPTTMPGLEGMPMPSDEITKPILLDDELREIHDAVPSFIWVLNRDGFAQPDYPTLPPMTLKHVTIGQFLQYVQAAFPGVQCVRIDGPEGSLYSIRIAGSPDRPRTNHVRLYRLSDIINAQANESEAKDKDTTKARDERMKTATNDVLSLLQAALDQTDPDGASSLKIHEPTLTLMFKGSLAKQEVLEEALQTLTPSKSPFFGGGGRSPRAGGFSGGGGGSVDSFEAAQRYTDIAKALMDSSNGTQDQLKQLEAQRDQLQAQREQLQAELGALRAQSAQPQAKAAAPGNK